MIKLLVWEYCRSRLRASAWSKQELRSTVISDCPGPRELPPSPCVSLFVPRLVPLLGGQTSCRHKWGAGHAYASTSISTAPTHLSTPRPDFMEQIHITLMEKYHVFFFKFQINISIFAEIYFKGWSVIRGVCLRIHTNSDFDK